MKGMKRAAAASASAGLEEYMYWYKAANEEELVSMQRRERARELAPVLVQIAATFVTPVDMLLSGRV